MSAETRTFMERCAVGEVHPDTIDDFVHEWHESPRDLTLYEHLGMKHEDYATWVRNPDALPGIVKRYQQHMS